MLAAHQARQAASRFDPLGLGLIWLVDPDYNVTLVGGEIDQIDDRVIGASFQAPASTNRGTVGTVGTHTTFVGTSADFLRGGTGTIEQTNFAWFAFVQHTNLTLGGGLVANFTGTTDSIRVENAIGASAGLTVRFIDSGGAGTACTVAFDKDTTAVHLYVVNFDYAARTVNIYMDNVHQGSANQGGSPRDPTGLAEWDYAGNGTGSPHAAIYGPMGVLNRVLLSAERTNLYNWGRDVGWLP